MGGAVTPRGPVHAGQSDDASAARTAPVDWGATDDRADRQTVGGSSASLCRLVLHALSLREHRVQTETTGRPPLCRVFGPARLACRPEPPNKHRS